MRRVKGMRGKEKQGGKRDRQKRERQHTATNLIKPVLPHLAFPVAVSVSPLLQIMRQRSPRGKVQKGYIYFNAFQEKLIPQRQSGLARHNLLQSSLSLSLSFVFVCPDYATVSP